MRRAILPCAIAALVAACAPPPSATALNNNALDNAIARAVGDPSTCVLLADRASEAVVYRYGSNFNCSRALPACDRPGTLSADSALSLAAAGRFASCPSLPDGSRTVGWAEARVPHTRRDLVYSAVMEGQNALPGHEINARLADAFSSAGV